MAGQQRVQAYLQKHKIGALFEVKLIDFEMIFSIIAHLFCMPKHICPYHAMTGYVAGKGVILPHKI